MRTFYYSTFSYLAYIGKWFGIACIVAVLAGTASAFFLFTLDLATNWREAHHWIIWLLPLAGFAVGLVYDVLGKSVEAGNNLIIEEIHDPKKVIPLRMVPLVLGGTLISHLFGASVGREGTAVQMGAALADQLTQLFRLENKDRRILLMIGMSAGFASVFGTPLAGVLFGLEVLAIGRMRYDALFPCTIAAIVANQVALAWGVHHVHYVISNVAPITLWSVAAVMLAGVIFGLVGWIFAMTVHQLKGLASRLIIYPPCRLLLGGLIIAVAVWILNSYQYIGLGIPSIVHSFEASSAPWDFLGKFIFTVVSLGSGFKGGEVTPLFYIGATLGNIMAPILHLPFSMLAGLGLVAVFAGAANTPLAMTIMAIELFGSQIGLFAALACIISYLFSGHAGIYLAQRIGNRKVPNPFSSE